MLLLENKCVINKYINVYSYFSYYDNTYDNTTISNDE
jgi:hypothetical protein